MDKAGHPENEQNIQETWNQNYTTPALQPQYQYYPPQPQPQTFAYGPQTYHNTPVAYNQTSESWGYQNVNSWPTRTQFNQDATVGPLPVVEQANYPYQQPSLPPHYQSSEPTYWNPDVPDGPQQTTSDQIHTVANANNSNFNQSLSFNQGYDVEHHNQGVSEIAQPIETHDIQSLPDQCHFDSQSVVTDSKPNELLPSSTTEEPTKPLEDVFETNKSEAVDNKGSYKSSDDDDDDDDYSCNSRIGDDREKERRQANNARER